MHGTTDYDAVYHTLLRRRLAALYPDAKVTVINAGVGGDNAQKGLARLEADVIEKSPDAAVVCFGLNDINNALDGYTSALGEIFDRLQAADIEVIFMTPNMLNTYVDDSLTGGLREYAHKTAQYQTGGRMDTFMEAAVQTAQAHGAAVCDCYSEWKRRYEAGYGYNRRFWRTKSTTRRGENAWPICGKTAKNYHRGGAVRCFMA